MARSIEAIAQRVPAATKEKSDAASGDATSIDRLKVTRYKDGLALRHDGLHTATTDSEAERLPGEAVPASNRRSRRAPSSRESASNKTETEKIRDEKNAIAGI